MRTCFKQTDACADANDLSSNKLLKLLCHTKTISLLQLGVAALKFGSVDMSFQKNFKKRIVLKYKSYFTDTNGLLKLSLKLKTVTLPLKVAQDFAGKK